MRLIQIDGTPAAAATPARTPRTRRRVTGTGQDHERKRIKGIRRYMGATARLGTRGANCVRAAADQKAASPENDNICSHLSRKRVGHFGRITLTFRGPRGLTR